MSLFGSTPAKPATSGFTFGASSTTTTASSTPSLFGTTTTSTPKPLFGSTTPAATSTSLFGASTTTPAGGGLFGATAAKTTASTGLFGSTTTTTASGGGLFGSTNTSAASTSGNLFGTKLAQANASSFGAPATGGSLFGAKPATGGLFGAAAPAPAAAATTTKDTLVTILQNSDALVRSLTSPELFGDERDQIVARLNQLAAALGCGSGLHKADQQPVQYNTEGPFHRMKAIGYNRTSEYSDSDGLVALVLKQTHTELATGAQRQKFLDGMFAVLGSKPTIHAHIESCKALPDNCTEVVIYVTEKGRGRIASKELAAFLNQAAQKAQLEAQLKVDKDKIISRIAMDINQKKTYLKDPPAGFDASLWEQSVRENPDPARLLPYPIRGFDQLRTRQKAQISEVSVENEVLDTMLKRADALDAAASEAASRMAAQRATQKQLSHRLLRVLAMQCLQQRFSCGVDATEEQMQSALEHINARLNAPNQLKSRITDLLSVVGAESEQLREKAAAARPRTLAQQDVLQLKRYLARCQDGLESLVNVVNGNLKDLQVVASAIQG